MSDLNHDEAPATRNAGDFALSSEGSSYGESSRAVDAAIFAVRELGWRVFPVWEIRRGRCACTKGTDCPNPGKHPRTSSGVKDATTDMEVIETWAKAWPNANWAAEPVGAVVIDVDAKRGGHDSINAWAAEHDLPKTLSVVTGGGGSHAYYRLGVAVTNRSGWLPGVDLRSEGGYVLLPGSNHISGGSYQWRQPMRAMADASPDLIQAVTAVSTTPVGATEASGWLGGVPEGGRDDYLFRTACAARRKVGDDYDAVLALTQVANQRNDPPMASDEVEAKVRQAFKQEHEGVPPELQAWAEKVDKASAVNLLDRVRELAEAAGTLSASAISSSWGPADIAEIVATGGASDPPPSLLRRSDGKRLLYGELLNGLHGESESGKTWVALFAVAQVIADDQHVLYLDFESSKLDITSRLMALGLPGDRLVDRFTYIGPQDRYTADEMEELAQLIASGKFTLTVLDGVTDAMSVFGLKPRDESDFAQFKRDLLLPLTIAGSACVTIDHIARGSDGKEALGTQHKRASVRGSALHVEVITPFARGKDGAARLVVAKDRPGWVRGFATRQKEKMVAGIFTLATDPESGSLTADLVSVEDYSSASLANLAGLSQAMDDQVEAEVAALVVAVRENPGATGNALKKVLGTGWRTLEPARSVAIERGLIIVETGPRNAELHYPGDISP